MDTSFPRWMVGLAIGTAVLSSLFVLQNLGTSSFWHDEAFSGLLIRYDWPEMISRIQADVHPPLYYALLRGWADLWNGGAYALRAFSYLFGLATAAAMYLLSKAIFRRRDIAIVSAVVFLTNSFVIQYLLEARMYTLGCFFVTLAAYFLLKAIEVTGEVRARACMLRWLMFGVLSGAALLTHYYAGIYIIAIGAYALFRAFKIGRTTRGWHVFQGILTSGVIASLLFLPWMRAFLAQVTQVTTSYWIGGITWWSVPETFFKMLTGVNGHTEVLIQQIAMLVVFVLVLWSMWRNIAYTRALSNDDEARNRALLLPFLIILPFVLSILLSLKTSIYYDRYFIYSLPFLFPSIIAALASLSRPTTRTTLLSIMIIGSAVLFPLRWYSLDIGSKPGMKAVTAALDERIVPSDTVIVGSSFALFTYRYHKTNSVHELLYAPTQLLHYSGTALLSDGDTITSLDAIPTGTHVWSVDITGFSNYQLPAPETWERLSELSAPDIYDFRGDIILREWLVR